MSISLMDLFTRHIRNRKSEETRDILLWGQAYFNKNNDLQLTSILLQ